MRSGSNRDADADREALLRGDAAECALPVDLDERAIVRERRAQPEADRVLAHLLVARRPRRRQRRRRVVGELAMAEAAADGEGAAGEARAGGLDADRQA